MNDKWQDMDNERDKSGKLTDTAIALDEIASRGCSCENEDDENCFAHLCEKAIKEQWTRAEATEKRVAELERDVSNEVIRYASLETKYHGVCVERDTERKRAEKAEARAQHLDECCNASRGASTVLMDKIKELQQSEANANARVELRNAVEKERGK